MERSGKEAWDALTKAKQTLTAGLAELDIATYRVRETPPVRMTRCEHCRYCRDMGWYEGHRLYCTWRQVFRYSGRIAFRNRTIQRFSGCTRTEK